MSRRLPRYRLPYLLGITSLVLVGLHHGGSRAEQSRRD